MAKIIKFRHFPYLGSIVYNSHILRRAARRDPGELARDVGVGHGGRSGNHVQGMGRTGGQYLAEDREMHRERMPGDTGREVRQEEVLGTAGRVLREIV